MTGREAEAQDVVQDVFAALWRKRDRLPAVRSLRAYLFRMARNRVYNQIRDEQTRRDNEALLRPSDLGTAPPSPDAEIDGVLLHRLLDRWIEDLPARQREALTLRRVDGLSHQAIASIMEISPHTVNNHLVRALDTLRDRLQEHRPDLLA